MNRFVPLIISSSFALVCSTAMAQQTSGRCNEYVGTEAHTTQFLIVAPTVVAAIDGHR